MHSSINNLNLIKDKIKSISKSNNIIDKSIEIVAVSKTFEMSHIKHLVDYGHDHYGENKVQEAIEKWTDVKKKNDQIKLHLIGKLQTNKVKHAVKIFDYIHSVDSIKLARKISEEQKKIGKKIKFFIQVNIGSEEQKSGIDEKSLDELNLECINLDLNVIGLMCIPPNDNNSLVYFKKMRELANRLNLKQLSMGMSSDYLDAIKEGSTFVRVGSKIFGERSK